MSQDKTKLSRRKFLFAVGASSAAGAAAIMGTSAEPVPPVASAGQKRTTKGYFVSAHIRNYYRTAKV